MPNSLSNANASPALRRRLRARIGSLLLGAMVATAAATAAPQADKAGKLIDMLVAADLDTKGLTPKPLVDDLTHLRRATLAIAGRIPTYEEIKRYEADTRSDKRSAVVDDLVLTPDYSRHLYTLFADFLRLRTHVTTDSNLHPYRLWLQESLAQNMPYNQLVKTMLTAEGSQFENPAAGYYLRDSGMPLDNLAMTTQVFLGTRMQCAQCHNHPTEKWQQVDFFRMASLVNSSTRARSADIPLLAAIDKAKKEQGLRVSRSLDQVFAAQVVEPLTRRVSFRDIDATLPHDYAYDDFSPNDPVRPAVPLAPRLTITPESRRIAAFADWLTADDNDHFAMVMTNRLWRQMMGRGLFEPLDNINSDTVITNKALLTYLSQLFRDLNYDMRAFIAILAKTETFQRQAVAADPAAVTPFAFQGPQLRRMSAEQIWDSFVYLLRGNTGLQHPYLQGLETEYQQQQARFRTLSAMPPEEFVNRLKQLQTQTDPIDPQIEAIRHRIPDAPETEKRQLYSQIRTLQEQAAAAFQAAFPELSAGGAMPAMSMMAMQPKTVAPAAKPAAAPRSALDQKWDQYLMVSAHMVSPVNPGHELLVFGASERELADAASTDASVPQALIMLNGDNGPSLFWETTILRKNLEQAKSDDEAIDCLFLSLMGRHPSPEDRALAQAMIRKSGRYDGLRLTALAITQTNRFIFVD